MSSQTAAPWLAFAAAIVAAAVTAISGFALHYQDARETRKYELMTERKHALFAALHAIDLVYANVSWDGRAPLNPHEWDINIARDAVNKMLIFCADPKRTVGAFYKAVGLHNPSKEAPPTYSAAVLDEFRQEVARELELPAFSVVDSFKVWIASLPGTKETQTVEALERSPRTDEH